MTTRHSYCVIQPAVGTHDPTWVGDGETYRVQCDRCGTERDAGLVVIGDPDDDGTTAWATRCACGSHTGRAIR